MQNNHQAQQRPSGGLGSLLLLGRMQLVELLSSRRMLLAALLACLAPGLALLIALVAPESASRGPAYIHAWIAFAVHLQVVVPLTALLLGAGVVADEVEGRTITYLFTRPLPRPALLLGRLGAVLIVLVPLTALSSWAIAIAASQREGEMISEAVVGMVRSAAAGAALYATLGAVLGVLFKRALIVSLAYAFAVEGLLGNLPGATQRLSLQYWLRSFGMDLERAPWSDRRGMDLLTIELAGQGEAGMRLLVIALVLVGLGAWLIRRRQYVLTSESALHETSREDNGRGHLPAEEPPPTGPPRVPSGPETALATPPGPFSCPIGRLARPVHPSHRCAAPSRCHEDLHMQRPLRLPRLRLRRPLLGLALGLPMLLAFSSPAEAQRRVDRSATLGVGNQRAGIELTVGNRGVQLRAGHRTDHRDTRYVERRRYRGHRGHGTSHGRWETRCERVWVPGPVRRIWVPAVYETYYDPCGRAHQRLVRAGYYDTIQEQGHWETRQRRVWVPYRRAITAPLIHQH